MEVMMNWRRGNSLTLMMTMIKYRQTFHLHRGGGRGSGPSGEMLLVNLYVKVLRIELEPSFLAKRGPEYMYS